VAPQQKIEGRHRLPFSVDAALLRELGERLVGRPHIALAELIKNAYDADATHVELSVEPDHLLVADDGHGMTDAAFRDRWMRVGSPHKEKERFSPTLKRPMTGSKGIGRLSTQFLGTELELWTQANAKRPSQIYADIDWLEAREQNLITEAQATVGTVPSAERIRFAGGARHGTAIRIEGLNQQWGRNELEGLAQEVWALQPPFSPSKGGFEIKLKTPDKEAAEVFESQASAYLDVWYARIKGELARNPRGTKGTLEAELEFFDGERHRLKLSLDRCLVHHADIEIRIYYLKYRKPKGLSVADLRDYFGKWGGVHVYDAGFRLPYYGTDVDWLEIEQDFSRRLSTSQLLPSSENIRNGLQYLPANQRLFGEIRVSTNDELNHQPQKRRPDEVLQIQASRDRLVDNRAFEDLRLGVRTTLDWYANRQAARVYRSKEESGEAERISTATEQLEDVASSLEPKLPKGDYKALSQAVETVRAAEDAETSQRDHQTRLMATLASAGAASLVYEHEVGKQFRRLERISRELKRKAKLDADLQPLAEELQDWLRQAKRSRSLFSPILEEEKREAAKALPAAKTVRQIVHDLDLILEGVAVELDVDSDLRLPRARYAEWSAIFQNAFSNAVGAMREVPKPQIRVLGGTSGKNRYIRIEDNGSGVDLEDADRLFEPFERGDPSEIGPGTGLGLPIARMLADSIGVRVAFVESAEGMSTSLRISWRPKKS
jgi:signal transduction histidine kinase